MKKFWLVCLITVLVLSVSTFAFAADMPSIRGGKVSRTGKMSSARPAGPIQKAERGFMNAVFGWTEVPKRVVDKTKEYNNPIKGVFLGVFQGTCKAFARTASGAFDLATFPIGRYDKPRILPDMPAAK
ncbi:MAG: exosortase system-associated protein, TIGR04073 family [Candidatus Omnitrophota bacterium]|jgi:putative exosortase-associated protein (TIGR04073 family)